MDISVSVKEKRIFLEWFLQHFSPDEIEWLLEELIEDDQLLESIHFVDQVKNCPKGISIAIDHTSIDADFLFFKGNVKTKDVFTAYHELQLYKHETCFIHIDFPGKYENALYSSVIEADEQLTEEIRVTTNELIDYLQYEGELNYLQGKVNLALDQMNEQDFDYFSARLKNLKNSNTFN